MTVCPEHPKRDQNPKFTPLSETTSIPVHFIWESPPPHGGKSCQAANFTFFLFTRCSRISRILESSVFQSASALLWKFSLLDLSCQASRDLGVLFLVFYFILSVLDCCRLQHSHLNGKNNNNNNNINFYFL